MQVKLNASDTEAISDAARFGHAWARTWDAQGLTTPGTHSVPIEATEALRVAWEPSRGPMLSLGLPDDATPTLAKLMRIL